MGRGRIISPDFWSDGNIVKLTFPARLFFIGMWNFAYCDKGHLPDDAADLKLKILPADQVNADDLLAELVDRGRVVRVVGPGGKTFLSIPTFGVHQKADDPRWTRKCPVCLGESGVQTTTNHDRARSSTTEHGVEGNGVEGNGGGKRQSRPARYCPKHPNGTTGGCFACRDLRLERERFDKAEKDRVPSPDRLDPASCRHKKHPTGDYCAKCETPL